MAYTVQDDPEIVRTITSHIERVRDEVLKEVKDTVALAFMGGFSRGEGSVTREAGRVLPLGDYDFLAITQYPHPVGTWSQAATLASSFGIDHVDFGTFWNASLPFVGRRIFWYELKFGSRLLFGDGRVLQRIPIRAAKEIDPREGLRLMFNRMQGMLREFDPRFLVDAPPVSLKRKLVFESVKGILACGDALLTLRGMYHYSYRQRLLNLRELLLTSPRSLPEFAVDLLGDFEEATRFKLQPVFARFGSLFHVWLPARDYLLNTIRYCWERCSGRRVQGLADFPRAFVKSSNCRLLDYFSYNRSAIARFGHSRALFRLGPSPPDIVRAALFDLALSTEPDGINGAALDEALRLVACLVPHRIRASRIRSPIARWVQVREMINQAWSISRK